MATFVLVHGAFQGGWVWHSVASLLRKRSNDVFTPTLTGTGERVHLLEEGIDLGTYVQDVVNVIFFEGLSDVILVGHSYAGMIITAVASRIPNKISRLIYLDAVAPEPGKSFVEKAGPEFGAMLRNHVAGWQVRPWPLETFGICCEEDKRWFSSKLAQFPLKAFESPFPELAQAVPAPRSYIHCTEHKNGLIKRIAAQCKHDGWDYHEMPTTHSPMVTQPERLVTILDHIAATASADASGSRRRLSSQKEKVS